MKLVIVYIFLIYMCLACEKDRSMPCGPYPDQTASEYILPYHAGERYIVDQGNCSDGGSHQEGSVVQYAYDFLMPVGTEILATRSGIVYLAEGRYKDGTGNNGQENFINIIHTDGTVAGYVHLTQDGSFVMEGDTIVQGDIIGLSGNSGNSSKPHLHFHVQECIGCSTIPITFNNTSEHPEGLVEGNEYTALDY